MFGISLGPFSWLVAAMVMLAVAYGLHRILPANLAKVVGWVVFLVIGAAALVLAAWGLSSLSSLGRYNSDTMIVIIVGLVLFAAFVLLSFGHVLRRIISG
jgi:hypothetical protein